MGVIGKVIGLYLPCMLTEMELQSRSMMLAETVIQKDVVARDKKHAMKEFKDQLTGLDDRQRQLVDAMKTGIERRMVSCHVLFHVPQEGTKRIVRIDTGEMVKEKAMTAAEIAGSGG